MIGVKQQDKEYVNRQSVQRDEIQTTEKTAWGGLSPACAKGLVGE